MSQKQDQLVFVFLYVIGFEGKGQTHIWHMLCMPLCFIALVRGGGRGAKFSIVAAQTSVIKNVNC